MAEAAANREQLIARYDLPAGGVAAFDAVARFAGALCDVPIALVSIVETCRQRFIAVSGLDETETPREQSFCAHAMLGSEIMIVPDAAADPRFSDNPLVTGAPHIRFYAGAPLVSREGVPLGALCVVDSVPRAGLTPLQAQGLTVLADQIMTGLEAGRDGKERAEADRLSGMEIAASERRFRILADAMPQMVWSTTPDGLIDYCNARWYEFYGITEGSIDVPDWDVLVHRDDRDGADAVWAQALATGDSYEYECRLRHNSGEYRWVLARALPVRGDAGNVIRWFGTCTDIHEQKRVLEQREILAHELSHRIKNIFSVIGGLIGLSARSDPKLVAGMEELRDRVVALGRAHDFVRPSGSGSKGEGERQDSLIALMQQLFEPYHRDGTLRVMVSGDDVRIDDRSATPLAMIFHELATNSAKYGSLSVEKGTVSVSVANHEELCTIHWVERGGPTVHAPGKADGFGTRLIELSGERQLGGTIERDWAPEGLAVTLAVRASAMSRPLRETA